MIVRFCLFAALFAATSASALDLPSTARLTAERISSLDRYLAPVGSFDGSSIPTVTVEGKVRRQAWQVPGASLTPLQILEPLRETLLAEGFEPRLDCIADQCGGFDFRFGIEVLPAPAMFVGLRNFMFLTMSKGPQDAPDAVVTLLVSTSRDAAYVQIIEAGRANAFQPTTTNATLIRPQARPDTTGTALEIRPSGDLLAQGSMVLDGVVFNSGATTLEDKPFPALEALARILSHNPKLRIALVGHTDSVGSLESNIDISRRRARAVRDRMIQTYGIAADRMEAEGMGYLAPRASNLTEAGRRANRRVEAIVLSNT